MIANSVSCYHSKHNFKYKNIAGNPQYFLLRLTHYAKFSYNSTIKGESNEKGYIGIICCIGIGGMWSGV